MITIPTFEQFINEGLWASGMKRAENGEERLGDMIDSNIKELKPVDLGFDFLFADQNLIIEGNDRFTYNDLKPYLEYIHKHGWRLMTKDEVIEASELTHKHDNILFSPYVGKNTSGIKARLGDETLYLPFIISQRYTDYLIDGDKLCWRIAKYDKDSHGRFQSCGIGFVHDKRTPVVRLVKDKPVNEGLWSAGMKRVENDEARKEDLSFFKDDSLTQPTKSEFKDYYLKIEFNRNTLVYHYPKLKPIAKFKDFVIVGDGTYFYENLEYINNTTKEEKDTISSNKFMEAISDHWIPF